MGLYSPILQGPTHPSIFSRVLRLVPSVGALARELDERMMQPVRKLLGTTRRIFLAPEGDLNLIPFGALVDENGRYLVEDYSLNYLTAGRDLLRLQAAGGDATGAAAIVADPQFDLEHPFVTCKSARRRRCAARACSTSPRTVSSCPNSRRT